MKLPKTQEAKRHCRVSPTECFEGEIILIFHEAEECGYPVE